MDIFSCFEFYMGFCIETLFWGGRAEGERYGLDRTWLAIYIYTFLP